MHKRAIVSPEFLNEIEAEIGTFEANIIHTTYGRSEYLHADIKPERWAELAKKTWSVPINLDIPGVSVLSLHPWYSEKHTHLAALGRTVHLWVRDRDI